MSDNQSTPSASEDWKSLLIRNAAGDYFPNVYNAMIALTHAPEWRGRLTTVTEGSYRLDGEPFSMNSLAWNFTVWAQGQAININVDAEFANRAIRAVAEGRGPAV